MKSASYARMLAENQDQPLLPRSLELHHLFAQFFERQRAPHRELVAALKSAIGTIVDAIVAHIERGEKHNPVAVDGFLQFLGGLKNTVEQLRLIGAEKDRRLFDAERLLGKALRDDVLHAASLRRRAAEQLHEIAVIDKIDGSLDLNPFAAIPT